MRREVTIYLSDPDSSDDYVPLNTEIRRWAMAALGSRRPPANMRQQTLPPAAGAATGSIAARRQLLAPRPCCAIADIAVGDSPRPRHVVAPNYISVAEFSAFASLGLSLCSIAEPAPSVRTDRTDAAVDALPLDLLLVIQRPAGARLSIRRAREPLLGPGSSSSAIPFTDVDLTGLKGFLALRCLARGFAAIFCC